MFDDVVPNSEGTVKGEGSVGSAEDKKVRGRYLLLNTVECTLFLFLLPRSFVFLPRAN